VIEVVVEDAAWTGALPEAESLAAEAASAALAEGVRPPPPLRGGEERGGLGLESAPPQGEGADAGLVVLLADDAMVRELNARFRGKDSPTNVLSFPAPPNPERHLGDVALAYGVCAREAAEQGKPLGRHLQHLVVHGVLHLLGYDHMSDDEAEAMEGLERIVLAGLGAPDPYQADGTDHD
jgi:probable rRNA maturation factor